MRFFYLCLMLMLAGLSFLCGIACVKDPGKVIRFQQAFYARINWRLEPISMEKELRNTRGMGFFLLALSAATLVLLLLPSKTI